MIYIRCISVKLVVDDWFWLRSPNSNNDNNFFNYNNGNLNNNNANNENGVVPDFVSNVKSIKSQSSLGEVRLFTKGEILPVNTINIPKQHFCFLGTDASCMVVIAHTISCVSRNRVKSFTQCRKRYAIKYPTGDEQNKQSRFN